MSSTFIETLGTVTHTVIHAKPRYSRHRGWILAFSVDGGPRRTWSRVLP